MLDLDEVIKSSDKAKSALAVKLAAHLVRFHSEVSKYEVCKSIEAIACLEKNEIVEVWAELKKLRREIGQLGKQPIISFEQDRKVEIERDQINMALQRDLD